MLTVKPGHQIRIGDSIIKLTKVGTATSRIGINAPASEKVIHDKTFVEDVSDDVSDDEGEVAKVAIFALIIQPAAGCCVDPSPLTLPAIVEQVQ